MKIADEPLEIPGKFNSAVGGPPAEALKTVLIVACNEKDAHSTREMLLKINVTNPIEMLPSADDLLTYLKQQTSGVHNANILLPALILLDMSTRHESGFGLLRWLHDHFGDHGIPIAVLTSKRDLSQLRRAYQLGARSFLRKPLNSAEFKTMAEALKIPIFYSMRSELDLPKDPAARRVKA